MATYPVGFITVGDRLGIFLKQLERYEEWEYQKTTTTQLLEVAGALDLQIHPKTTLALTNNIAPNKTVPID